MIGVVSVRVKTPFKWTLATFIVAFIFLLSAYLFLASSDSVQPHQEECLQNLAKWITLCFGIISGLLGGKSLDAFDPS